MQLTDVMLAAFDDRQRGGFFFTAADHEELITRQKDLYDNAVPSGNSMAALVLVRLGKLTGESKYLEAAAGTLRAAAELAERSPQAAGQLLMALNMYLGPTPEIVVLGDLSDADTAAALAALRQRFVPNKVLACRVPNAPLAGPLEGLFAGKTLDGPPPAVYICENFSCQAPVYGRDAALAVWGKLAGGSD